VFPTLFDCSTKRYWVAIFATNGGRGFVLHSCHSEVRADITITIRRIIIQIPRERACIRAIIRITAEMHDAGIPCENPSDP
jgi:hypothetical protein